MRYSKFSGRETPRGVPSEWYDLREFLDLKDLHERYLPPPRQKPADALAASTDWVPQSHLDTDADGEEQAGEPETEDLPEEPS